MDSLATRSPSKRRIKIGSTFDELRPVPSTGLGKALILDFAEEGWIELFRSERRGEITLREWLEQMPRYIRAAFAFEIEEIEDRIRRVDQRLERRAVYERSPHAHVEQSRGQHRAAHQRGSRLDGASSRCSKSGHGRGQGRRPAQIDPGALKANWGARGF